MWLRAQRLPINSLEIVILPKEIRLLFDLHASSQGLPGILIKESVIHARFGLAGTVPQQGEKWFGYCSPWTFHLLQSQSAWKNITASRKTGLSLYVTVTLV